MKAGQLFDSVVKKYFKNIIINLIFSAAIMFLFYKKSQMFIEKTSAENGLVVIIVCEIAGVLLCAIHTACLLHKLPAKPFGLLSSVFVWGSFFSVASVILYHSGVLDVLNTTVLTIIFAVVYIVLYGMMALLFCICICGCETSFFKLLLQNIMSFIGIIGYCVMVSVIFFLVAAIPVNTTAGKRSIRIVPKEITEKWEPTILLAIIFLVAPIYDIAMVELFLAISDSKRATEPPSCT